MATFVRLRPALKNEGPAPFSSLLPMRRPPRIVGGPAGPKRIHRVGRHLAFAFAVVVAFVAAAFQAGLLHLLCAPAPLAFTLSSRQSSSRASCGTDDEGSAFSFAAYIHRQNAICNAAPKYDMTWPYGPAAQNHRPHFAGPSQKRATRHRRRHHPNRPHRPPTRRRIADLRSLALTPWQGPLLAHVSSWDLNVAPRPFSAASYALDFAAATFRVLCVPTFCVGKVDVFDFASSVSGHDFLP